HTLQRRHKPHLVTSVSVIKSVRRHRLILSGKGSSDPLLRKWVTAGRSLTCHLKHAPALHALHLLHPIFPPPVHFPFIYFLFRCPRKYNFLPACCGLFHQSRQSPASPSRSHSVHRRPGIPTGNAPH